MDDTSDGQTWLPSFLKKSQSQKSISASRLPNESTHLLPKPADGSSDGSVNQENGEVYDLEDGGKPTSQLVLREFVMLIKGSIPVIVAYALQMSLQTISVLIVGRRSPQDLATAAFSYMFAMSTGWLIALGGTTAIDTLGSSAFTGSKNPHDLGIILQRSFLLLGLFYFPVCLLWLFSESVFLALGQEAQMSRDSARFLSCLIPGGIGYIYFEAMKKYLQAQGTYLSLRLRQQTHANHS